MYLCVDLAQVLLPKFDHLAHFGRQVGACEECGLGQATRVDQNLRAQTGRQQVRLAAFGLCAIAR